MADDRSRPLRQHLEELRWRLLVVVAALLAGAAVSAVFFRKAIELLTRPAGEYLSATGGPVFTEVAEMLGVTVKVALLGGAVLAAPVAMYQVARFVAPGMTKRERRYLLLLLPGALALFLGGVAFAYFVLLPPMLRFLLTFGQGVAVPMIRISSYINLVVTLMFWLGLVFQTPLAMFTLAKVGVVSPKTMAGGRRGAVVAAFILGALITPTFDPVNQALVALPVVVLYELGIWLSRLAARGEGREPARKRTGAKGAGAA